MTRIFEQRPLRPALEHALQCFQRLRGFRVAARRRPPAHLEVVGADTDAHWIATVVLSEPIPGLIHRDDDAVPTQGHHFPVERPEDGAAQRNAVDEGLVRRFHLGDVDGAADVTLEAAVSANARDSVIEYRAVETVAPSQAILEGERLPRGQRLEVA